MTQKESWVTNLEGFQNIYNVRLSWFAEKSKQNRFSMHLFYCPARLNPQNSLNRIDQQILTCLDYARMPNRYFSGNCTSDRENHLA